MFNDDDDDDETESDDNNKEINKIISRPSLPEADESSTSSSEDSLSGLYILSQYYTFEMIRRINTIFFFRLKMSKGLEREQNKSKKKKSGRNDHLY